MRVLHGFNANNHMGSVLLVKIIGRPTHLFEAKGAFSKSDLV